MLVGAPGSSAVLSQPAVCCACSGECKGSHKPGDGSGCSWKVTRIQKVVNASCVQRAIYSNIEVRNQACFTKCAQASGSADVLRPARGVQATPSTPNRSSPCVNSCFQAAVIGTTARAHDWTADRSEKLAPMTAAEILAPWRRAFAPAPGNGVCPPCVLDSTTAVYSCPTSW